MTDDPHNDAPGEPDEVCIAILSGDRLCVGCGYNLTGQRIIREPHHGLLIARCPECGQVTSIQEYPLLGRWATRWGVILATLWFILVLAAWPLSAMIMFGFAVETAEKGSLRYGGEIRRLYRDARTRSPTAPQTTPAGGTRPPTTATADFQAWWETQDQDVLLADSGGWFRAVDWRGLLMWLPAGLLAFALGWFWSIVLLHLRRRALLLWGVAVLALAAVFVMGVILDWSNDEYPRAWDAGRAELGPPLLFLTLAWCAIALTAGLLLGRSLTRFMIRVLLSPRFRGPLAVVWTADGLAPPPTRGGAGSG